MAAIQHGINYLDPDSAIAAMLSSEADESPATRTSNLGIVPSSFEWRYAPGPIEAIDRPQDAQAK